MNDFAYRMLIGTISTALCFLVLLGLLLALVIDNATFGSWLFGYALGAYGIQIVFYFLIDRR